MNTGICLSKRIDRQAGVTLVETLIGLALSLVVIASMVALMSSSLGSASRIIQMSQLTDELRNSMNMMSRDVRRANYSTNSVYCYGNSECGDPSTGTAVQAADVTITTTAGDTCMVFGLDRNWDGNANNDGGGAFRRNTITNSGNVSVGVIEMWVGTTVPTCADGINWVPITDPEFVDVTDFDIARPFFEETIGESGGTTVTKRTRRVQMQIGGRLVLDNTITRRIEDTVKVRNDLLL